MSWTATLYNTMQKQATLTITLRGTQEFIIIIGAGRGNLTTKMPEFVIYMYA